MRIGIYDPSGVTVIVGTRKIDGFFSGTFVDAKYNNPKLMKAIAGSRGEYALSKNADRTGMVTIVLHIESASNAYLDSLAGAGSIFPFLVQSNGETVKELATAPEGWIEELPEMGFDADQGSRTWQIGVGDLKLIRSA